MKKLIIAFFALSSLSAFADQTCGKIVSISDGLNSRLEGIYYPKVSDNIVVHLDTPDGIKTLVIFKYEDSVSKKDRATAYEMTMAAFASNASLCIASYMQPRSSVSPILVDQVRITH